MIETIILFLLFVTFCSTFTSIHPCRCNQHSSLAFTHEESHERIKLYGENSESWMESLRARQQQLDEQKNVLISKWRNGKCTSQVKVIVPDWVRRLDVEYPFMACGSAAGNIYVANLESGEVVAMSDEDQTKDVGDYTEPDELEKILALLYGTYDGGGTLALAFAKSRVCEASRNGGVNVWIWDPKSSKLILQGRIKALENTLVTCLYLEEDFLWVGTAKGKVQAYPLDEVLPIALQSEPRMEWILGGTILSLEISTELGCGLASTSLGGVTLFSIEDEDHPRLELYPPSDAKDLNIFPISATIVRHKDGKSFSIACGSNDGSLYLQPINVRDEEVLFDAPFEKPLQKLLPKHFGPLKCLACPAPGLLVSGGHDGSMRVWDAEKMSCLYQFVGYKVWLGSLWTDGIRLVSDGADNTVIVHDFEKTAEVKDDNK